MNNGLKNQTNRLCHLDLCRLIAIYLVIFNHTGDAGYMLFTDKIDTPMYFPYMVCSVFCKIAVPLFFMISGALLLPKQESLKQLFLKRIFRMCIILVVISVPYYLWLHISQGLSVWSFLTFIYSESATTALWYLYSYIALLLMLPFLRSMVKNMQQQDFLYLTIGYITFVGILPCLEYLLWSDTNTIHESFYPVLLMTQNVFFSLMGYYFEHIFDYENGYKKFMRLGVILSTFAIFVTCFMTYYHAREGEIFSAIASERFFNCFICIPTITVYCFVKRVGENIKNAVVCKWISICGSAVFGVYLIEKFLRAIAGNVYSLLLPYLGSFISSLVFCLVTFCLGMIIVIPLKHIPIIKRLVNKFI